MDELEECFEKGLLKRTEQNNTFAALDIKQAEFFLEEAFDMIELNKK